MNNSLVWKFREKLIILSKQRARQACASLPVAEAFESVYQKNLWGGRAGEFYSGTGSDPEATDAYCTLVREFILARQITSVVDLGCGDFRVGQKLLAPGTSYVGVDVVPSLIERNSREFGAKNVKFQVVNAIDEKPPAADLCLIRQVLQHLSNQQILAVLQNCRGYRYLMISDHLVMGGKPHLNVDKPHGYDTRPMGLRLDLPPFNLTTTTMLEVGIGPEELVRTVLIEQQAPAAIGRRASL